MIHFSQTPLQAPIIVKHLVLVVNYNQASNLYLKKKLIIFLYNIQHLKFYHQYF